MRPHRPSSTPSPDFGLRPEAGTRPPAGPLLRPARLSQRKIRWSWRGYRGAPPDWQAELRCVALRLFTSGRYDSLPGPTFRRPRTPTQHGRRRQVPDYRSPDPSTVSHARISSVCHEIASTADWAWRNSLSCVGDGHQSFGWHPLCRKGDTPITGKTRCVGVLMSRVLSAGTRCLVETAHLFPVLPTHALDLGRPGTSAVRPCSAISLHVRASIQLEP